MPADMDNHNSLAVRRRGATKHSVEDQALDQIAKEKFVGFGSGRSSNEPSDEEVSRPVTPVQELVLQPENRQSKKKKKGRSKKKSKIEEDETEELKDENSDKVPQEVPEIFLEDLSEAEKSKDNSTSQDVSSSDLSENVPGEKSEVDIWAERDDDDFARMKKSDDDKPEGSEEVNFDDFWSEFDEGAGKVRVRSDRSASVNDTAAESIGEGEQTSEVQKESVENSSEEFQTGKTHNEAPKSDNTECEAATLAESETVDGVDSLEENNNVKLGTEKEKDQDVEEVDDFWANHDEDEAFLARKTSLRSSSHYSSESPEKSQTPDRSRSKSQSLGLRELWEVTEESVGGKQDDSGADEELKNNINQEDLEKVDESPSGDEQKVEGIDSIWEEEDLPPIFKIKKSKSPSLLRQPAVEDISGNEEESQEKSDSATEEFSRLPPGEDSNDDVSPSREKSLVGDDEGNGTRLEPEPIETEDESTTENDDGEESEDEESPETCTKSDSSPEKTSPEKTNSSTEVDSSAPEEPESAPKDAVDSEYEEEDSVREVAKKKFSKTIQDLEAPTRRRSVILADNRERTEVRPPTPPPLPRSPPPFPRSPPSSARSSLRSESSVESRGRTRHVSETSTDGEVKDDGIMDFLGKENDRAEARLAARRQARVEAREIRMKELERLQKEQEENSDKVLDLHCTTPPHINNTRQASMSPRERPSATPTNSYHSSRRSSEDSMEDGLHLRDIRHELKEVEDKFRKAMIANAQLDNEKAAHAYQVELLKDRLEDLEEAHALLNREYREKCREHESLKRVALKLREDLTMCKMCLDERDRLIADHGLIIVGGEADEKGEPTPRALVTREAAEVLDAAGEGSLDVRLKALANEKNELADEVRHLKLELEEERNRRRAEERASNGPLPDDVQQTLNDYRFRLQKTEQETSTLQATVARLESQVIRYKSAAEESEKAEEELKQEKRKLLREHRESIARIEELETSNSHLQRRMDKLKNAKSTLLKEL